MTDGDKTLRNAAMTVFCNANALLCAWHIIEKSAARQIRKVVPENVWNEKIKGRLWNMARTADEVKMWTTYEHIESDLRELGYKDGLEKLRTFVKKRFGSFASANL